MMKSREHAFLEASASPRQPAPASPMQPAPASAVLPAPASADCVSGAVVAAVEADACFLEAHTVLAYMAMPGEVQLHPAFARWQELGKRIAIPLVRGDELIPMEYDPAKLTAGYRGIIEPADGAEVIAPEEIDLALVPGVAFTLEGFRLGRGKGFYDRLLPKLKCPKLGVCFPFRIVPQLPVDPWDIQLDKVIANE